MTDKQMEAKPTDALWIADALLEPVEGFPEPTQLEQKAADALRTQHARILALIKRAEDLEEVRLALLKEIDRHREIIKRGQDERDQLRAEVERLTKVCNQFCTVEEVAPGAAPTEPVMVNAADYLAPIAQHMGRKAFKEMFVDDNPYSLDDAMREKMAAPKPLTRLEVTRLWNTAHNDTTERMAHQVLVDLVEQHHGITQKGAV